MKKLFYFPSEPLSGYQNPYCNYAKEALNKHFKVLDMERGSKVKRMFTLLAYSFRCDVIIFNWLESVPFFPMGTVQFYVDLIALFVLKVRKVQILFMYHDLVSHFGDNWMSRYLMRWLFRNANVVISHSKEAAKIARTKSNVPSYFFSHPIKRLDVMPFEITRTTVDVFIWGALFTYKGIYEFISLPAVQNSKLNIFILGGTKDDSLRKKINSVCNDYIVFEERRAEFDEIAAYCKASRYVLFPYVGESVSSSGALIDTIVFGGNPIGPNRGAFKDLNDEGVCIIYNSYEELISILGEEQSIDENKRQLFIDKYSYNGFAEFVNEKLQNEQRARSHIN